MFTNRHKTVILLVTFTLISSSIACFISGKGQNNSNRPEQIPITTEAAVQLEDNLEAAASASVNNLPFSLQLTEAQLTSAANLELASMPENRIENIQIYLRDNQIDFYADVTQTGLTLPVNITINIYAFGQGQVGYNIITAKMGPFPIPDSITNQVTNEIDQFILTELNPTSTGLIIDDIQIANGVMTINGHNR